MKDYFGSENRGLSLTTDFIVITKKIFYLLNHEATLGFCQLGESPVSPWPVWSSRLCNRVAGFVDSAFLGPSPENHFCPAP